MQTYFVFESSSFVVYFAFDETGVPFGSPGISALQVYTYSESNISVYTENTLSTLLNSLMQCCSVH